MLDHGLPPPSALVGLRFPAYVQAGARVAQTAGDREKCGSSQGKTLWHRIRQFHLPHFQFAKYSSKTMSFLPSPFTWYMSLSAFLMMSSALQAGSPTVMTPMLNDTGH